MDETNKTLNKKLIDKYNKGSGNLLLEDKFLIDDNGLDELMTGTIHDKQVEYLSEQTAIL